MDDKERVLTLASASRMTGVEQKKLQSMIDEGRLEAVKTEGGNLLISESSLKLILEESQIIENSHSDNILSEDVKKLLSQAAFFIERQESELKTYKERERKQISLLEGAEVHINKFLDQINIFSEAKIVIGLHGAGLSNLLFCQPKTKVIEIKLSHIGNMYKNLGNQLNLNYINFIGKGEETNHKFLNQLGNVFVDLNELEKCINS